MRADGLRETPTVYVQCRVDCHRLAAIARRNPARAIEGAELILAGVNSRLDELELRRSRCVRRSRWAYARSSKDRLLDHAGDLAQLSDEGHNRVINALKDSLHFLPMERHDISDKTSECSDAYRNRASRS